MDYKHSEIEKEWQHYWKENKTYKTIEDTSKEKFYVLDMFPYPSGAGLHVGHPLGYIASDIYARYKKQKGFNVLHPMGYDSFGLPAEQYAIQTGQHPAITTEENVTRYRSQLDAIGFGYDWDREVRTSSPEYYKWTQWIFKQIYSSWYNNASNKAEDISVLITEFETNGNADVKASAEECDIFTAIEWNNFDEKAKNEILGKYRLAFLSDSLVNWCPALGTVLANDEIKDGVSERGGHPVVQKLMRQWSMRITAYAERLLQGLDDVDFSDSLKEQQRNWIGKSKGASVYFDLDGHSEKVEVFTTRPDTIFGVSFVVLAPEHELVTKITTPEFKAKVEDYQKQAAAKSERDRQANVKEISGQDTGAFVIHPFTGENIPVWIGDYVLASYGTGAVMAVPAGDQRDFDFAKHFDLPIPAICEGIDISEEANASKSAVLMNSDFLNGLTGKKAIGIAIRALEEKGAGKGKTNFRLRDAIFSRQRYWGEPFPVYYKDEIPYLVDDKHLPITLPKVDKYLPTEDGEPPLARATKESWNYSEGDRMEFNTMPGWAGSSWYFLRYMDPTNENEFVNKEKADYWKQVDLYVGGAEHAVGHLLYSRFWTKFLCDKGFISFEEPFKKLINQGMIQGRSSFVAVHNVVKSVFYMGKDSDRSLLPVNEIPPVFLSYDLVKNLKKNKTIINDIKSNQLDFQLAVNEFENIKSRVEEVAIELTKKLRKKYPTLIGDVLLDIEDFDTYPIHVDINFVVNDVLDKEKFKSWRNEYNDAIFIDNDDLFICSSEVEKMSKSKYNVQTPDDLCVEYGADTLRLYEMFLGPLTDSKPWNTNGISGVYNFLKKLWRLFHDENGVAISSEPATKEELKVLHKTIKKVNEDLERYSFNTVVSNFMICVNELSTLKCNKKEILEQFVSLLAPYAPHISEELWKKLGHTTSVTTSSFPIHNESVLVESSFEYPVSFNGKMRFKAEFPITLSKDEIEKEILAMDKTVQYLKGEAPKKVIVVPKRIINIVM